MVAAGMSRKEIAQATGTCYATLRRYLGPAYNRRGKTKGAETEGQEVVLTPRERLEKEVAEGKREAPAGLQIRKSRFTREEQHTVVLRGQYAVYVIDVVKQELTVRETLYTDVSLTPQVARGAMEEMGEALEEMEKMKKGTLGAT